MASSSQPACVPPYRVTVAICTHNRAGFLKEAVESVLPQLGTDAELLIVDNASSDGTSALAEHFQASAPNVRACQESELGLSAARNCALRTALGDYVLFLDDDATAEPGWLEVFRQFLEGNQGRRIGAVGGAVVPRFEITPPGWVRPMAFRLDLGAGPRQVPAIGGIWGGNSAYHRQSALSMGGFDKRLGRKGKHLGTDEESDLNQRLQQQGYEIWWLPEARIHHWIPAVRLTLKWLMREHFTEGRTKAILRLQARSPGISRTLYTLSRIIAGSFQVLLCLAGALVTLPWQRGRVAADLLRQLARNSGFVAQMTASLASGARPGE